MKKGEMTIAMIIAIAVGVLLLVLLIFGITGGFGKLFSKVKNVGGTESNIADIATGCEVACVSNNVRGYCTEKRIFNYGKKCFYVKNVNNTDDEGGEIPGFKEKAGDVIDNCESCKNVETGEKILNCKYEATKKSKTCEEAEAELGITCGIACPIA